jgi:hypothetical protein
VRHEADGPRYIFSLRIPRIVPPFGAEAFTPDLFRRFGRPGVAALLDVSAAKLTPQELTGSKP